MSVPSINPVIPYTPTDAEAIVSKLGVSGPINFTAYEQVGAGTALANSSTATSIFNGAPAASLGTRILPANFLQDRANYINTLQQVQGTGIGAPPAALGSPVGGGLIRVHARGTFANPTTASTLTVSVGLTQGGTYTAYATSAAVTLVVTTATSDWSFDADLLVIVVGAASTASIYAGGVHQYFSGANAALQSIPLANTVTTATLDTTKGATVDAQFTWGTAAAANTITTQAAWIEVVN